MNQFFKFFNTPFFAKISKEECILIQGKINSKSLSLKLDAILLPFSSISALPFCKSHKPKSLGNAILILHYAQVNYLPTRRKYLSERPLRSGPRQPAYKHLGAFHPALLVVITVRRRRTPVHFWFQAETRGARENATHGDFPPGSSQRETQLQTREIRILYRISKLAAGSHTQHELTEATKASKVTAPASSSYVAVMY